VTPEILAQVDCQALAVWFCDDGTRTKVWQTRDGVSHLHLKLVLGGLTLTEYILIQNWFAAKGWVFKVDDWALQHGLNSVSLWFGKEMSVLLKAYIQDSVPECMKWKLGASLVLPPNGSVRLEEAQKER